MAKAKPDTTDRVVAIPRMIEGGKPKPREDMARVGMGTAEG